MKVLILSCNTGGGHNAAASALKESLNFYHHEAEVLDLMRPRAKAYLRTGRRSLCEARLRFSGRLRRTLSAW